MTPLNIHAILENAGADPFAPEGSQGWALAQVDAAVAELASAVRLYQSEMRRPIGFGNYSAAKDRLSRAFYRVAVAAAPCADGEVQS